MPISAKTLGVGASLEQIRQEFNNLQSDVNILQQSPTYGESLIFEGATSDAYETTLSVQDPTADRTVLLPNADGTILTTAAVITANLSTILQTIVQMKLFTFFLPMVHQATKALKLILH